MTSRAPGDELGGAVHAKETAPFKVGVLVALEHKDTWMAFAVWSKYEIGALGREETSYVFKNLAAVCKTEGQE